MLPHAAGFPVGKHADASALALASTSQLSVLLPLPAHLPKFLCPPRSIARANFAGSYGSVAEALDHATDPPRRVAIKRIPNVFDVFENAKRIYREISILRVLAHPNITGILHLERPP